MKIVLIFALICGSTLANLDIPKLNFDLVEQKAPRGINDEILKAIENLKKQMPCGFPDLGVPPLAPMEKPYTELAYSNKILEMIASLIDLRIDGLNVFDVSEIKFSVLTLKATFNLNFHEIQARSQYVANAFLLSVFKISGKGDFDVKLRDLRLSGFAQLGVNSNGLYMKNFNIVITLGGLKSDITGLMWGKLTGKLANKAIEKFVPMIMKNQQQTISDMAKSIVIEKANESLNGLTVKDILDLINNSTDPIECVPEKRFMFL